MKDRLIEAVKAEARQCVTAEDVSEFLSRLLLLTATVCLQAIRPAPTRELMKELFTTAVDKAYDQRLRSSN